MCLELSFLKRIKNMFPRRLYDKIRRVESFLYGGPETVEHNFEREDNFQADRERRRQQKSTPIRPNGRKYEREVWYSVEYDPGTLQVRYIPPESA